MIAHARPGGRPWGRVLRGLGSALLLPAAGCGGGAGPGPVEEILPAPSDTILTQWTEFPLATAVGSRWIVVSADWDVARLADLEPRSLDPLGGPTQTAYLHPFHVFTFRDTVYLADWGKRRTTVWDTQGRLADSIAVADGLRGAYVRARDAAGQLYFQVDPEPRRDGSGNRDSAAIVRAPRSLARFDTVARLAPVELVEMRRENVLRFEQPVFSGSDLWGVWPDGTVWIMRRFRNQLESVDPRGGGRRTRGPPLPDPVYEVTEADRELHLRSYPPDLRPKETDMAWAVLFPPFAAAFAGPDGSIWLEKTKPAADTIRRIQVLDRAGTLRRVLLLRGQGRLVAVGPEQLLIAVRFPEGIRLMGIRVPLPAASPPSPQAMRRPAPGAGRPRTTAG